MGSCPNLEKCGFVKKYGETKNLAVKGFVAMYCHCDKQKECKRKVYKEEHGTPPPDEMMPSGMMMSN